MRRRSDFMLLNLANYKVFRDMVASQSFSKAAEMNGITQSAVSQQLVSLEKKLGCRLVDRDRKEFALTREGERLYNAAQDILDLHERLLGDLKDLNRKIHGRINISTIYSIGLHDIPPYIQRFMRLYPLVDVHVEYERSQQVYQGVLKGKSEIGFVAFPEKHPKVQIHPFRTDKMVMICHSNRRLANFKAASIKQIVGEKFIGFDPDQPTRRALENIFKKHRIKVSQIMDFDNIETLKRAVEIDMGVSIVPHSTVIQELRNRTLKAVEFVDEKFYRPLAMISRKDRELSTQSQAFLKMLQTEI